MKKPDLLAVCTLLALNCCEAISADEPAPKLVIVAGKPSHPARMHEFNAGSRLLAKCLEGTPNLKVVVIQNGWPEQSQEKVFDDASAVVFYMDGGARHEVVLENGRRQKLVEE